MLIRQVEELIGIDRETIRFYIKEGLLAPEQLQNRYRRYTDADIEQLKRIKVLRQMGMSIPEVRSVFNGEIEFDDALRASKARLQKQQVRLGVSLRACDELIGADPKTFDPLPYYFDRDDA